MEDDQEEEEEEEKKESEKKNYLDDKCVPHLLHGVVIFFYWSTMRNSNLQTGLGFIPCSVAEKICRVHPSVILYNLSHIWTKTKDWVQL